MKRFGIIVGTAVCVLLAGCGSSPAEPTSTSGLSTSVPSSPAANTEPTDPAAPTPAALYARVRSAVIKAGTAAFSQQSITDLGDGSLLVTVDGTYNLKARSWQEKMTFQSDSNTYLTQVPDPTKLTTSFRALAGDTYLSRSTWPAALQGRWQQIATTLTKRQATLVGGPQGAAPEMLAALLALTPTSVARASSGWTLTGRVGANSGILALGVAKAFRAQNVNVVALKGSAKLSVEVGADDLPTEARIDGASVTIDSTVPDELRTIVPHQRGILDLRAFGKPVTIKAPSGHQVINPSELASPS